MVWCMNVDVDRQSKREVHVPEIVPEIVPASHVDRKQAPCAM